MPLRNSFSEILLKMGQEDQDLVVLVGDISHYRLQPFAQACPGRYYNIGICENTIVNMAAGLSKVGLVPIVHTISPFIVDRSFEQIKLDFCYQNIPGNILTVGCAFDYADLGCTHHCYGDFALLKTLPGTQLFCPSSLVEFETIFRKVYRQHALNYFRLTMHDVPVNFSPEMIEPGKAIKMQEGNDLTIIAVGVQLRSVLEALPQLKRDGLNADVIYIHTVRPLDLDMIRDSLRKTKRCLVIEEHSVYGGVFDDVLRGCRDIPDVRWASIAIPNQFIREYGTYPEHCRRLGFSAEGILAKVKNALFN